jgi:hypothetical protein
MAHRSGDCPVRHGSVLGGEVVAMSALNEPRPIISDDTPADAYGAGYTIHCLREHFRDLRRQIGFEGARQELAEIINAECDRRSQ